MAIAILPLGVASIVQSFVAQLVGQGRRGEAPRFAWYGLGLAVVAAVAVAAVIPAVAPALAHTDYSPAVRDAMASYMAIRLWSVGAIAPLVICIQVLPSPAK